MKRPMPYLLSAAVLSALIPLAHADDATPGAGKTLATVSVTGSNIKRTDSEGPNPVQVIDRQQLEQSGKVTVADALRAISANTGNATNETTNNGWASGSAGIGLRGLSQKNTLVLLNGRRLANYGFPANGLGDTFVNLNALPLVAVERIEVLKDGASAVYGSDAVAGVVNIITRQDFRGAELGLSGGASDQGGMDTQRAKFIGGIGDLDSDGYNILFSFDAYNRDRLDQDQRALTRSGIYTDLPGGRWNGWSAKGARYLVGGRSVPMLDAQGNCPAGTVLTASAPIDGLAGDTCGFNQAAFTTLIPSTKRYQAYTNATFRLNDTVEAFGEALYSEVKGVSIFGSSPYFTLEGGRFALNATSGLAEPVSNLLPASSPYNPYGSAVPIEYTFFDLGQTVKTNRSQSYRFLGGVRGKTERWDWEAAAFAARSTEHETVSGGFANRFTLAQALADGSYNLLDPSATPHSVIDGINLSTLRPAQSTLRGVDAKVSGNLFELPAGSVRFAAGASGGRRSWSRVIPGRSTKACRSVPQSPRWMASAGCRRCMPRSTCRCCSRWNCSLPGAAIITAILARRFRPRPACAGNRWTPCWCARPPRAAFAHLRCRRMRPAPIFPTARWSTRSIRTCRARARIRPSSPSATPRSNPSARAATTLAWCCRRGPTPA